MIISPVQTADPDWSEDAYPPAGEVDLMSCGEVRGLLALPRSGLLSEAECGGGTWHTNLICYTYIISHTWQWHGAPSCQTARKGIVKKGQTSGRTLSRRVRLVEGQCQEGSDWWKGIVKKGQTNGRTLSRRVRLVEGLSRTEEG